MTQVLSIFNTRELALIFWLLLLMIFIGLRSKNGSNGLLNILKIFFSTQIFTVVAICWIYLTLIIVSAHSLGWWNQSMLKDTVIWMLAVILLLAKVVDEKNKGSLLEILKDAVQPIIFVEFTINIQTLPLGWEILLLPFWTFLYAGTLWGQRDSKSKTLVNVFNFLLSISGIVLLIYCIYYVVTNFSTIDKHQQGLDFFLPLWLTITFVPCLYIVKLYSKYESLFGRINLRVAHRGKGIAKYFKRQYILKCGLSLTKLDKYDSKFKGVLIDSKSAVDAFFLSEDTIEEPDKNIKAKAFVVFQYLLDYETLESHRTLSSMVSNLSLEETFIENTILIFGRDGFIDSEETSEGITYQLTRKGKSALRMKKNGLWSVLRIFIKNKND